MKKLSLNYIKSQFEKEGYTLLTKKYKDAFQKLDYICPKGHKHSIKWNKWQQGHRCPYCSNRIKKTIEEIREAFEAEGYTLLTKEYKNNKQKLEYICPNRHKHSITWANWQQGQRCPYCYGNIKKTFDEIREAFEKEGYTLLTKKYRNNKQKLKYICSNGHINYTRWDNFQHGCRCKKCEIENLIDRLRLDYDFMKESFESEGYILLTKEYKNNKQKLDYICPNGHRHSVKWNAWQQGQRCPYCHYESMTKYYTKEDLEKFNIYKKAVYNLTNRIYSKHKSYINSNNYRRGKYSYHLDHIYSVIDGFENNISIDIMSNPHNLRIIPAKENRSKNGNSYISKMMLYHLAV